MFEYAFGHGRDRGAELIDEDNDLWGLRWLSIHCVNDRDDNISISLNMLVLVCMANTYSFC